MLEEHALVAFVATTDGARAREFYGDVLGLQVVSDDPYALVCRTHGTFLRIQKLVSLRPQSFTVLGWQVLDIAATVEALTQRSVRFEHFEGMDQDERGIWTAPSGARVAWFKDPDGNLLSITET